MEADLRLPPVPPPEPRVLRPLDHPAGPSRPPPPAPRRDGAPLATPDDGHGPGRVDWGVAFVVVTTPPPHKSDRYTRYQVYWHLIPGTRYAGIPGTSSVPGYRGGIQVPRWIPPRGAYFGGGLTCCQPGHLWYTFWCHAVGQFTSLPPLWGKSTRQHCSALGNGQHCSALGNGQHCSAWGWDWECLLGKECITGRVEGLRIHAVCPSLHLPLLFPHS